MMITVVEKQYMEAVIQMNRRMREADGKPDWEQRRYEIAKDAMAAMLGNPAIVRSVNHDGKPKWGASATIAEVATKIADLIVEELKKEKTNPIK